MRISTQLSLLLALSTVLVLPAKALSLGSYSLVEGSRTSVGGLSTSLTASSNGSSTATGIAQGDYTVVEVVAVADRPDMVRMALQAVDRENAVHDLFLYIPTQTYVAAGLQAGHVITATQRSYGVELAKADNHEAFFLMVKDALLDELKSTPVES